MKTESLKVKGMHCASCAMIIQKKLGKSDGVLECEVNYGTEKAKIKFDPEKTNLQTLSAKIEPLGYSLHVPSDESHLNHPNHDLHSESMHAEHLGLNQSKSEKEAELADLRKRTEFALPITLFVFFLMIWAIFDKVFDSFPSFFLPMRLFDTISFALATYILFFIGKDFLRGVKTFFVHRVANMDTLVGIGTLTAYLYSSIILLFPEISMYLGLPEETYFDVTIVVIGFITFGKYLEAKSKSKTGEAIEKLLNLGAKTALVERELKINNKLQTQETEIPIEEVQIGDIVIIKPGAKIPVDGKIVEGNSTIDESMITGESIPVNRSVGSRVIAGTLNKNGSFKFIAKKIGKDTLLSQIIKMVEEAQGSKAPIQKLADQISSIFVPIVLGLAFITLLAWIFIGSRFMPFDESLSLGLTSFVGILVIACPCALGLATPTGIITGVGKGANNGILIKNAESLEKIYKIKTVVLDKTGTITKGRPEITDISLDANFTKFMQDLDGTKKKIDPEKEFLRIAASLEKFSEHPLAKPILEKTKDLDYLKVEKFSAIEGKGVSGQVIFSKEKRHKIFAGNTKMLEDLGIDFDKNKISKFTSEGKTPIIVAAEKQILGYIALADVIKENAKEAIKELHNLGIKVIMLTGDNERTAKYIANQVNIDEVKAQVLPKDKLEVINRLQEQKNKGEIIAMAGDGINDSPALAKADVGIAMSTGADVAIESSDVVLLEGDISKITKSIKLSKMTMRTIKQNLFWAFIYNVIGIPVAAGVLYPIYGITLNPIFAGLAMAFSSVSVVANSLRLKGRKL